MSRTFLENKVNSKSCHWENEHNSKCFSGAKGYLKVLMNCTSFRRKRSNISDRKGFTGNDSFAIGKNNPTASVNACWTGQCHGFLLSRKESKLARCRFGVMVYLITWYPQYMVELLTFHSPQLGVLERPLCRVLIENLFHDVTSYWQQLSISIMVWDVFCYEFSVNDSPLRENAPSGHLLSSIAKTQRFQQALIRVLSILDTKIASNEPEISNPQTESFEETSVCNTDNEREMDSIVLAEMVIQALMEQKDNTNAFPPLMYKICSQLDWLADKHLKSGVEIAQKGFNRLIVVGGRFLILRYINPFLINYISRGRRNEVVINASKLLLDLCNEQISSTYSCSAKSFRKQNFPKMVAIVDALCCGGSKNFNMEKSMHEEKSMLNVERDLLLPGYMYCEVDARYCTTGLKNRNCNCQDARPSQIVHISGAEVRILIKSLELSCQLHRVEEERSTLLHYFTPMSSYLTALVGNSHYLDNDQYVVIRPHADVP